MRKKIESRFKRIREANEKAMESRNYNEEAD
jgi:hypothetical protein